MKGNGKALIIAVLFSLLMLGMSNISAAKITGSVFNATTKEPLPGSNVFLEEKRELGSATNIDGRFVINDIPTGNWTISVSSMGFGKVSSEIEITDLSGTYEMDFRLYPTALKGNEIVVTATRKAKVLKDLPIRTEVITRQEIVSRGVLDLYQALEGQPGVRVEQQCSNCNFSMLRMQGLEGGYAEILVDGQPIFTGLAGVYGLQQIMSSNIEQVEIIKGAGSALYGPGALSGILNITTKEPDIVPSQKLRLNFGDYKTSSIGLDGSMKSGNIALSYAFQLDSKGAIDQTGNIDPDFIENGNFEDAGPDGFTDRLISDNYGAVVKAYLLRPFGEGSKLVFSGNALGEFRKGGYIATFEDPFDPDAEHIRTRRNSGGLSYLHDFESGNHLELNLTFVDHYRNATNGAAWDKAIDAGVVDDELELTEAGRESLDIIGLAEFEDRFFPKPFIAQENLYLADAMFSQPIFGIGDLMIGAQYRKSKIEQDINGEVAEDEKSADDFGAFAQIDIQPFSEKIELIAGARVDNHSSEDKLTDIQYKKTTFNPRLAARYFLSEHSTIRASYGSGVRVPYLFSEDLHLCASSPRIYRGDDLEPEKASSFNIGIDFTPMMNEVGLGVFYTKISDKIEFIDPGGGDVPTGYDFRWKNVGDATTYGSEVYLRGYPLSWLSYNINAVYTNARFDEKRHSDLEDSDVIPRSPEFTAFAELVFEMKKAKANLSANYTGSMFIDHVPEEDEAKYILEKTDGFVTVDAGLSYSISRSLEVHLNVKNLFDYVQPTRDITDAAYIYAPLIGRQVLAGLTITL